MRRELLGGCGRSRDRRISVDGSPKFENVTTLDINLDHAPDVVWDLTQLPLPFPDDHFDEAHFYEVLEHTGQQGDYRFFFAQFAEIWRILKPSGLLCATCPAGPLWTWGDPSHTRVINRGSLVFLDQEQYATQVGKTAMSDFRYLYQADFTRLHIEETEHQIVFILQAVKPSRYKRGES